MKDLLAYLFGDSQIENEVEDTKSAIEQIMEEAEEQEPLKVERKPLQTALKTLDISGELEYDPEGFSLVCSDESDYRRYTEILLSPDAMEKLAKLGWVMTRCGDVAMSNEPAEFRIRFLEVSTAGEDSKDKENWPAPNPKLVTGLIKKGREFMDEPGPHDDDGPLEYDDKSSDDNQKGIGKAQAGKDPEGKLKGATGKTEAVELAEALLVNEGEHRPTCDSCEISVINGVPIHEQGCPNSKKTFRYGRYKDAAEDDDQENESLAEGERCPHCEGQGYVDEEGNPKNEDMAAGDPHVHRCPRCKGMKTMPSAHAARYKRGLERNVNKALGRPAIGEARHKAGCQCGFCKNMGSFRKKKEEPQETDDSADVEEGLEVTEKPYVNKHGKQRMVPWLKPKAKEEPKDEAIEPPRYDDMFEAIAKKKAVGIGKPKSHKTVPKAFKRRK